MPRKAPPIQPKDERDKFIDDSPPYVVTSKLFYDAFKCDSRETRVRDDGKVVVSKRIKGDSINLLMIYNAFANHASSETHLAWPTYGRIATLLRISPESVKRGLHELYKRGLLKFAYRKPNKSGEGFVNVVRVIHDNSLSAKDEQSIASYPQAAGHPRMSAPNQTSKDDHLGDNSQTSKNDQQVIEAGKQVQVGHPGCSPFSRSSLNDHGTVEHKKLIGHGLNGSKRDDVLNFWQTRSKHYGLEVPVPGESDLQTASELEALHVPMHATMKAIESHLTDCIAFGLKPHDRLQPVVQALVQNPNGR